MTTSASRGIATVTSLRLCSRAPGRGAPTPRPPPTARRPPARRSATSSPPARSTELHPVEERVDRGRTGLDPFRKAVAARDPVVAGHVDRLRRAALDQLGLEA